jgi:hypothetical protein
MNHRHNEYRVDKVHELSSDAGAFFKLGRQLWKAKVRKIASDIYFEHEEDHFTFPHLLSVVRIKQFNDGC